MSVATETVRGQGVFLTGELVAVKERSWTDRDGNTRLSYNVKLLIGEMLASVGYRTEGAVQAAINGATKGDVVTLACYYPRARLVGRDGGPKEPMVFFDGIAAESV